ncbi:MAG: type II toxin-antitoxin system RelE/ParE family toxin [Candidatus Obscuribacterales bacterium]|nr:type II toxin-antitoxin system RelE/ParE family toxin [Candidatus Obscuribacterales bacterium]
MITSFADANTEALFNDSYVKAIDQIISAGRMKLGIIDTAEKLSDLRNTPGNRLEELKGDRSGQHSI